MHLCHRILTIQSRFNFIYRNFLSSIHGNETRNMRKYKNFDLSIQVNNFALSIQVNNFACKNCKSAKFHCLRFFLSHFNQVAFAGSPKPKLCN